MLTSPHVEFSRIASSVVALPETTSSNVFRVGDIMTIPLYDGAISTPQAQLSTLHYLSTVRIGQHSIRTDIGPKFFGGLNASSDRAAAYKIVAPGRGSINVLLKLPDLHERCTSCRTVHFYFLAEPAKR